MWSLGAIYPAYTPRSSPWPSLPKYSLTKQANQTYIYSVEEATKQTKNFPQSCMRKFADREQAEKWFFLHGAYQSGLDLLKMCHGKVVVAKGKELAPVVEWQKVKVKGAK